MAWNVFTTVGTNLGMGIENVILLVVMAGMLIFYAKDFKIGLILQFISAGILFALFYTWEWNYSSSLVVMFMILVIMALTLRPVDKAGPTGGSII